MAEFSELVEWLMKTERVSKHLQIWEDTEQWGGGRDLDFIGG